MINGQIITSKENDKNEIIKFEQLNIDLDNLSTTTIKKPKIQETSTIKDAIANLDLSGLQIALVVEKNNKLIGSITDGDIRRSLLAEYSLDNSVVKIMTKKPLVIHSGLANEQIKLLSLSAI